MNVAAWMARKRWTEPGEKWTVADKKRTDDIPITGEAVPRYEVRIGERVKDVPDVVDRFNSLEEARDCLARKKRLDKACYIWDGRTKQKVE